MQRSRGFVRIINAGLPDKVKEYSYKGVQTSYSTRPVSLSDCLHFWQRVLTEICQESKKIPSRAYLEVRYEDLVLNPQTQLCRMARFLEIPATKTWLRAASGSPLPGYLWMQRIRIGSAEYKELTRQAMSTLKGLGYFTGPYLLIRFFHLIDALREFFNYLRYGRAMARLKHMILRLLQLKDKSGFQKE